MLSYRKDQLEHEEFDVKLQFAVSQARKLCGNCGG